MPGKFGSFDVKLQSLVKRERLEGGYSTLPIVPSSPTDPALTKSSSAQVANWYPVKLVSKSGPMGNLNYLLFNCK